MSRDHHTSKVDERMGGRNFLITILHEEHHSLQGKIQWLDTGLTLYFRSELEMMNLIQEATRMGQENTMRTWKEATRIKVI